MRILVIGGAGFIGSNLVSRALDRGDQVMLLDNLERVGARENLLWLEDRGHGRLRIVLGDAVRDTGKLERLVAEAEAIYHLAGQVAVTTSLVDPRADHAANLTATLNVLEAMRGARSEAPLVFASTNKVYGGLTSVETCLEDGRWSYGGGRSGIGEDQPLDFHSPYGCSKGGADQYVRDFARVYGLNTLVFRQSCIYGPRQFGIEDQGWLVHFLLAFTLGRPITVYGDGRQVRDALFVDDLLDAFDLALPRARELRGEVFNIGGGPANRISILELLGRLEAMFASKVPLDYRDWRKGDQRVFVSDNRKASRVLGWEPRVTLDQGLDRTAQFVTSHRALFERALARARR